MEQQVDLSKGGIAVVMVGHNGLVQEYLNNPSVKFIECTKVSSDILEATVPSNTKAVIITEGIPNWHYTWITSYARRKNIPFFLRKTNQAIYDTLKGFFPANGNVKVTLEEVKETESKGKLNPLVQFIDFNRSNSENAKVLFAKATEKGIKTTLGSLGQFIAIQRRKTNHTAVPRSVRSKLDISVELLDKMIEDLGSMRDFIIQTTEDNRIIKSKLERITKAME